MNEHSIFQDSKQLSGQRSISISDIRGIKCSLQDNIQLRSLNVEYFLPSTLKLFHMEQAKLCQLNTGYKTYKVQPVSIVIRMVFLNIFAIQQGMTLLRLYYTFN